MESREIRCCGCGRLLFKIQGGSLGGTISIKCPRCRQFNHLRPESPQPERRDRGMEDASNVGRAPRPG